MMSYSSTTIDQGESSSSAESSALDDVLVPARHGETDDNIDSHVSMITLVRPKMETEWNAL